MVETTGSGQGSKELAGGSLDDCLQDITEALRSVRFGEVRVTFRGGRVVEITTVHLRRIGTRRTGNQ